MTTNSYQNINFRYLRLLRSCLFVLGLSVVFAPFNGHAQKLDPLSVRIAILKETPNTIISARGKYKITYPRTNQILFEGRRLKPSRVLTKNGKIYIGKRNYPLRHIRIHSQKDISLVVNKKKKRYRGIIDIVVQKDDKILVLNILDLEQYVKGVLYHEVKHRWPIEVIKAQAVATRTYALYRIKTYSEEDYDVTSDIYSQVYGGKTAERYRTNLAAERTKGEILLYDGDVLPAYFHANSGGHTEDASVLWKHDLSPLKGVKDPYSKDMPNFSWKKNFRLKDVQDKLNANGYDLGLIKEIRILKRTPSGRVKNLLILTRDGHSAEITGKNFRQFVGPNLVKSNLYYIDMQGYYFDLIGKGWGHGVGMSQWGAYAMAKKRFAYEDILNFYYPGCEIVILE